MRSALSARCGWLASVQWVIRVLSRVVQHARLHAPAVRQLDQVIEIHDVHAARTVAARGRNLAPVWIPSDSIDRRRVARQRERLIGGKAIADYRPDLDAAV